MGDAVDDALKLQREAAREGFDWSDHEDLWTKLFEEIAELRAATGEGPERIKDELGDVLFMLVNIARHLAIEPADALRGANAKFRRRYGYVMQHAATLPPLGDPQRLDAMERIWQQAKRQGL